MKELAWTEQVYQIQHIAESTGSSCSFFFLGSSESE